MISSEKTEFFFGMLAIWNGFVTADLVSLANNCGDQDFDEPALWDADPDLALEISDMLDVESMLALGGCLDDA